MSPPGIRSEAEARLERVRQRYGLPSAVFVGGLLWACPIPDLSQAAHRLAAIGGFTIVLWITEAIPLPAAALLGPSLAVVLGVCEAQAAFAPFAHPVIFLFMGGFLLAAGLSKVGFDRRAALWLISRAWIRGSPRRALIALSLIAFSFSMWISNTAATAMLLPVALGLQATIGRVLVQNEAQTRVFGAGMVLSLAYAASLGGIATPIGTAPNVIALSLLEKETNIDIDFIGWMTFALPVAIAVLVVMLVLIHWRFPAPSAAIEGLRADVLQQLRALGPLRAAERRVLAAFGLAVLGWLLPSLARIVLGPDAGLSTWSKGALDEGAVAMLAAGLLFLLSAESHESHTADSRPGILDGGDIQNLDWGTLLLLGGGISLGSLAFDTGLAEAMGRGFLSVAGPVATTEWGLVALSTLLVLVLTEVTSNTATTSMMLPVIIGIAKAGGHDPKAAVVATTIAASCAFMLPVSTPPNAIIYGSRLIRLPEMVRTGIWLDVLAYIVLVTAALTVLI